MIEGSDGFLYGTTIAGGSHGTGTLYKIRKDGTGCAVLYAFLTTESPRGSLLEGLGGFLYGSSGGSDFGSIFRIAKDGAGYQTVYRFCQSRSSPCRDGSIPNGGLVQGEPHVLYGTTAGTTRDQERINTTFRLNLRPLMQGRF